MITRLTFPMLLATGLALATACRAEPGVRASRDITSLWAAQCAYCHTTGVAPALAGRQLPVALITAVARTGTPRMPALRPTDLTDDELVALSRWISALPADAKGATP